MKELRLDMIRARIFLRKFLIEEYPPEKLQLARILAQCVQARQQRLGIPTMGFKKILALAAYVVDTTERLPSIDKGLVDIVEKATQELFQQESRVA